MLQRLWKEHRIVFLLFAGAALVSLVMLVRIGLFALYWANPEHHRLDPAPWMTPGYIAHSWEMDPGALYRALDIPRGSRPTLHELARTRGLSDAEMLDTVRALLPGPAQ